ncbi:MAG: hypothetical protein E6G12_09695 [Actinobacteria bacterium]|nr:MAG: hypothetical protein E6G12_09695 [Actinomycetota bacterium]
MVVTAPKRTSACGRQAVRRPLGELRIRLPELRLEARGRLQVMAQYFVELDEALAVPFEPAGETLVKLGAGDLGEGVVGGVADQDVAKAEGVLTGEEWLLPLDEVLPHERGQERCDLIPLSERLNGLPMEDFPFDRAALEHRPLQGVEPVEASGDQGLEVRGHDELVFRLARHGEHLGEEEWIAAGGPSNPLAKRSRQSLGQKRVRIVIR